MQFEQTVGETPCAQLPICSTLVDDGQATGDTSPAASPTGAVPVCSGLIGALSQSFGSCDTQKALEIAGDLVLKSSTKLNWFSKKPACLVVVMHDNAIVHTAL